MLTYPDINPVLVSIGPLQVHWYGLMYLFGFILAYLFLMKRSRRADSPVTAEQVEDLILYGALGVVIGGRCGYVFFYGFDQFLREPLWLFKIWTGGMSFHGGLLGVMVAMWLFARRLRCDFVSMMDFIAPAVPIGLGLGRLGNFINQELWGRPTDVSWAMIFPNDPLSLPRHPSQLYQFALEGVLLFVILWLFSRKPRPRYSVSALFLTCYGLFRFLVEFVREPDNHIGFDSFGWMTRGQELCIPMIIAGLALFVFALRRSTPGPVVVTHAPVSAPVDVIPTHESPVAPAADPVLSRPAKPRSVKSASSKSAPAKAMPSKPAPQKTAVPVKPAVTKPGVAKPAPARARPASSTAKPVETKTKTVKSAPAKPATSKPATKSTVKPATKPATGKPASKEDKPGK